MYSRSTYASGGAHRVGKRRVVAEHLERAFELREAVVRNRCVAALRVPVEHLAPALHERGSPEREGLGQDHREALEERRLRERERARQGVVARLVVDEAGDDDVVAFGNLDQVVTDQHEHEIVGRMTFLVGNEEVDERERTLALVDAADVEQIRLGSESVGRAESFRFRSTHLDSDADHLARRVEAETGSG